MPRKARIDTPIALHHIIVRGIERRRIFSDDRDRDNFVERLGDIVTETQTGCFAWGGQRDVVSLLTSESELMYLRACLEKPV